MLLCNICGHYLSNNQWYCAIIFINVCCLYEYIYNLPVWSSNVKCSSSLLAIVYTQKINIVVSNLLVSVVFVSIFIICHLKILSVKWYFTLIAATFYATTISIVELNLLMGIVCMNIFIICQMKFVITNALMTKFKICEPLILLSRFQNNLW